MVSAGHVLAVAAAFQIDGQVVAVAGGSADLDQLAEVGPQAVDLGVDLLLGDDRVGHLDPQPAVAGQVNLGPNLDHGVERHGPDSSPSVMSISGAAMASTSWSRMAWE